MNTRRPARGFTLLELLIVITVIAILSGVLVPRVATHMKSSRDARRLADIKQVRNAIEQYFMDTGVYPPAKTNPAAGGWDVSNDGDFIPMLVQAGYLPEVPQDPTNDATYHYRYYVYNAGDYGCIGPSKYYVLGVKAFETAGFAAKNKGFFKCAGRDWSAEFAYVTGGGASWK
jgi:type II secretion system protein G